MDINFDEKEGQPSSKFEIDKLKRDLNAENFQNIYNIHNNSMTLENHKYNLDEDNNNANNNIENNNNTKNNKINKIKDNNSQEEENNILLDKNINEQSPKKEEHQETIPPESEEKSENQVKIINLIPLWYKCLNKEHGYKYISLDGDKKKLICKYCFQNGVLETNLDLNQEFIDKYKKIPTQNNKKNNFEISKEIIKETSEENITDKEETSLKLNLEEKSSNKSGINKDQINCLTLSCTYFPYYFCETCRDFICYKCIFKRKDENDEKSSHIFHDIKSVNYDANSFRDDIIINLDTIENITSSLDFLINEEKIRIKNINNKIIEENKKEIINYKDKTFERIKAEIFDKNKELYNNFCGKYENKDNDVNDLYCANDNIKNNVANVLGQLKIIKEQINDKDITNEDKCELHNKYIELLKEANILIQKGNSTISQSNKLLETLNNEELVTKYNKSESSQNKILLEREKIFIQSLSNNRKNKGSYKLNRFVSYRHEGTRYFGFSTLEFSCKNDIILFGISLCGKYLSSKKLKQKDYSEISITERSFYEINVKLYKSENKLLLINENSKLYEIIDANNPIININFEKGIKLNKDKVYIIVVENLENEKYLDLWVGSVLKESIANKIQKIKCNSSNFEFDFRLSSVFNSDLNEFQRGIIEGILYGE